MVVNAPERAAPADPVHTEQNPAIEFLSVSRQYAGHDAVDNVSFQVHPGEFVALVGPSGSGKTTTLMMVAGFETPSSGEVRIDGTAVTHVPPHLRNIGVVFQSYALFPHLTVAENIAFPLRVRRVPRGDIKKRVAAALKLVRLPNVGHRYPSQLSGGQQQRIAVARALVFGPSVLLMDEPLGALDRSLREEMQYELKALQQELQVTVLYVTHDQGEAMAMADRIGVMKDAHLLQLDDPHSIYHAPADRFVASFVGECNFIRGRCGSIGIQVAGQPVSTGRSSAPQETPPAGEVELAIRPHSIRVTPLPNGTSTPAGELAAVIRHKTFLGALTRLDLLLDDEQAVIAVLETGNPTSSILTSGDRVSLGWSEVNVYAAP